MEEEEAWDNDDEEDGDEGMKKYGEEIDGPNKDAERYNNVSDMDEDVDRYSVWGGGVSEAEE